MHNHEMRLNRLEEAIRPSPEPLHILRVIIDPTAPGDMAVAVIARGDNGEATHLTREPEETKEEMCQRAERAMAWMTCATTSGRGECS